MVSNLEKRTQGLNLHVKDTTFATSQVSPKSYQKGNSERTGDILRLRRQINKDHVKLKNSKTSLTNLLQMTNLDNKEGRNKTNKVTTSNQSPQHKSFMKSSSKILKPSKASNMSNN